MHVKCKGDNENTCLVELCGNWKIFFILLLVLSWVILSILSHFVLLWCCLAGNMELRFFSDMCIWSLRKSKFKPVKIERKRSEQFKFLGFMKWTVRLMG